MLEFCVCLCVRRMYMYMWGGYHGEVVCKEVCVNVSMWVRVA